MPTFTVGFFSFTTKAEKIAYVRKLAKIRKAQDKLDARKRRGLA